MSFKETITTPVFEITALEPTSGGSHRVVKTWVTDGAGVVDAFESGEFTHMVLRVDVVQDEAEEELFTAPWSGSGYVVATA